MLQISTGMYFPDGADCHETLHRAVFTTNGRVLSSEPIDLPVGRLTFTTSLESSIKRGARPDVDLVALAIGGDPLAADGAVADASSMGDDDRVEIRPGVAIGEKVLADFAARHGLRRLAAFGSVLRADFTDESDIDLLVEFEPGRTPGLLALAAMELELGELFGREVDLRTAMDLSPYFRDVVVGSAHELYAA